MRYDKVKEACFAYDENWNVLFLAMNIKQMEDHKLKLNTCTSRELIATRINKKMKTLTRIFEDLELIVRKQKKETE